MRDLLSIFELLLTLNLHTFGLRLPLKHSLLNHVGDLVHGEHQEHQNKNANENIASLKAGQEIGGNRREDHFEGELESSGAHEPRQIDVFLVHLLHAGIGVEEI